MRACRFQPECITRVLRRCRVRFAAVGDVPFRFVGSHEAVPFVEAVRIAAAQSADANGHSLCVGVGQDRAQHGSADAFALMRGYGPPGIEDA